MGLAACGLINGVWICSARLCFFQALIPNYCGSASLPIFRQCPSSPPPNYSETESHKWSNNTFCWKWSPQMKLCPRRFGVCRFHWSAFTYDVAVNLLIITDMWRVQEVRAASICWWTGKVSLLLSSLLSLTADLGRMDLVCHRRSENNSPVTLTCLSASLSISSLSN